MKNNIENQGNRNIYKVKEGDTLYSILKKFGKKINDPKKSNHIILNIGDVIEINNKNFSIIKGNKKETYNYYDNRDNEKTYTVKAGDTLYTICKNFGISVPKELEGKIIKPGDIISFQKGNIKINSEISENKKEQTSKIKKETQNNLYQLKEKKEKNGNSFGKIENYEIKSGDTIYSIFKENGILIKNPSKFDNIIINKGDLLNFNKGSFEIGNKKIKLDDNDYIYILTEEQIKNDTEDFGYNNDQIFNNLKYLKITDLYKNIYEIINYYSDYNNIPDEYKLLLITKGFISNSSITSSKIKKIEFRFFSNTFFQKATAGNCLDEKVKEVEKDGIIYKRNGYKGEFFDNNGKRLIIGEGTILNIIKISNKETSGTANEKNDNENNKLPGVIDINNNEEEKFRKKYLSKMINYVNKYSKGTCINVDFLYGLVFIESTFSKTAFSNKKAKGYFQVTKIGFDDMFVKNRGYDYLEKNNINTRGLRVPKDIFNKKVFLEFDNQIKTSLAILLYLDLKYKEKGITNLEKRRAFISTSYNAGESYADTFLKNPSIIGKTKGTSYYSSISKAVETSRKNKDHLIAKK